MRLEIRSHDLAMAPALQDHIKRRLLFVLGRFTPGTGRVTIHLADMNGPRGGLDKRCRIIAWLGRGGRGFVEDTNSDLKAAVHGATDRLGQTVRRQLERRCDRRRYPQKTTRCDDRASGSTPRQINFYRPPAGDDREARRVGDGRFQEEPQKTEPEQLPRRSHERTTSRNGHRVGRGRGTGATGVAREVPSERVGSGSSSAGARARSRLAHESPDLLRQTTRPACAHGQNWAAARGQRDRSVPFSTRSEKL